MRTVALLFCAAWLGSVAAVPGQDAALEFTDVSGTIRHPLELDGKAGSVLVFYWHDCPICNSYVPEINRLYSSFTNFEFYIVDIDPDWTLTEARTHARDFGFRAPYLLDGLHRLAALARATATPEAVVFGRNEAVLYRGRIDNAYASLGLRRASATAHDLRDALVAIAAGKTVTNEPPPIGCFIPNASSRK